MASVEATARELEKARNIFLVAIGDGYWWTSGRCNGSVALFRHSDLLPNIIILPA